MRHHYRPIISLWRHMSSQAKGTNTSKGSAKKTSTKTETQAPPEVATATSSGQVDDGTYRSPEYYGHNDNSFYDYMIDMSKYRLKQPSNKS